MTREEQIRNKARELGQTYFPDSANIWARSNVEAVYVENACVEMAEWADSHPRWIPVEERLPKENEEVLAYNAENEEVIACDYHHGMFHCWPEVFSESITHWMPLPPPPAKKGGQDDH